MPRKVLLAMPQSLLQQIDAIVEEEGRMSRSELVREVIRKYVFEYYKGSPPSKLPRVSPPPTEAPMLSERTFASYAE